MKVILLENLKRIGSIGEIIDVKRGYARNFLIANKKALYASKENINQVQKIKTQLSKKDNEKKLEAKKKPINKKIDCPENMPKEMCEIMQKLDCPEDMSINECALKQANKLKKDKSPGEASNRMQEFLDQMKSQEYLLR